MARSEAALQIGADTARETVKAGRNGDEPILAAAAPRTAARKPGADKIEAMLVSTGRAKGNGSEAQRKAAEETCLNEVSERTERAADAGFVAEHTASPEARDPCRQHRPRLERRYGRGACGRQRDRPRRAAPPPQEAGAGNGDPERRRVEHRALFEMPSNRVIACRWLCAGLLLAVSLDSGAAEQRMLVAPRVADERLAEAEPPHFIAYAADQREAPLLVWLSGTGGQPSKGPPLFYETALRLGYRLLALSYLNVPAVSQVCTGAALRAQPDCAGRVRQHRAWGEPTSGLIGDRPEDAIVPRLTRLLQHLARSDERGPWRQYLDGDEPRWARIVLVGQSQGGGMAAFIAQTRAVAGVILFSGGWDRQPGGDAAQWYSRPSLTPPERWHGSFHRQEAQAAAIERTYQRLGIPAAQVHALSLPLRGANPHVEGISNPDYAPLWEQMLQLRR